MRTESIKMHVDRTNEITMAREPASAARPIAVLGLVRMPTLRTAARCSSFGAAETADAGLFGFVRQIVNVFAVFPLRHALVVMPPAVALAYATWVADEQGSDVLFDTEVDDLARGFVAYVSNATFCPSAHLVLGMLQLFPATGVLLAASLLLRNLPKLLVALPLEGTDTPTRDDQGGRGRSGYGSQVNFSQVNSRLNASRGLFSLWNFDANMQFKAAIPAERASTYLFRYIQPQDQGRASFAHRQDHFPFPHFHSLGRPVDRIEPLDVPGVLHLHLWMARPKLASGLDVSEEGMHDHLHRLAV